jgi:hypothetical protein
MIIDTGNLDPQAVAAFLVAVIMAIIAWWQNQQKNAQVKQVAALTPGTKESTSPAIIDQLPVRSWKMDEPTKQFLIFDATPENRALILQQVHDAEFQYKTAYRITFNGGWNDIEYGLIKAGQGNPSGK